MQTDQDEQPLGWPDSCRQQIFSRSAESSLLLIDTLTQVNSPCSTEDHYRWHRGFYSTKHLSQWLLFTANTEGNLNEKKRRDWIEVTQ